MNKRRKNSRQRGSHTHGWGSKKKHRGAGSRGGKGMAGSGKRADSKKPNIWKDKKYFGAHGFSTRNKEITKINVCDIVQRLSKMGKKEGEAYSVDLTKQGIDKLLGKGKVNVALNISVKFASKKAIEIIENAGGKVILPEVKE